MSAPTTPSTPTQSTPTPSLRRRATLAVLVLFALLLLVVGSAVDVALGAQLRTELDTRLADTAERARAFSAAGFPAASLPDLLVGQGIRIRVTAADGQSYGDAGLTPPTSDAAAPLPATPPTAAPPTGPPDAGAPITPSPRPAPPGLAGPPPPGLPGPPEAPAVSSTSTVVELADGGEVLLVADTTQLDDVRGNLRAIMALAGVVVLALAAVVLLTVVGRVLRPLDRLTAVAGRIGDGDRGERLRPDRAGTDLGRAAVAFDRMLDALEATEARARTSADDARAAEARTRRFLSDAAHELRTPLAGMQAVAEQMLARSPGTDDPQHRRAVLLARETTRTSRLVTDMLDLARIDSGLALRTEAGDLAALVDAEVDRIRTLAPGLAVRRTGDPGPVPVVLDPGRIAQVLANLGDNARRHTPHGGTITLDVADGCVTVTDTGPGIPLDQRERVFERLVRLDGARDRESGGAGLGLSIARGLARAHGGDLAYLPQTAGAGFRLTLPR